MATGWLVEGCIDGRTVTAWWDRRTGRVVSDDDEVSRRAERIVATGESFSVADDLLMADSLKVQVAAILTAMRAVGDITAVELDCPIR